MSNSNYIKKVNSLVNSRFVIYHNLPYGGAKRTFVSITSYLHKRNLMVLIGIERRVRNIFQYIFTAIFLNTYHDYILSKKFTQDDILIVFQNWLSYAPPILLFAKPKSGIYVCHEPPREYSDKKYLRMKSFKNKLIDLLRLPIKHFDKFIVSRSTLPIISNSYYSKANIDKYYGVESKVIYPGYDSGVFKSDSSHKKLNQVICVGAINRLKNQLFIIEVISKIKTSKPSILLIANGYDPDYLKEVQKKATYHGISLKVLHNISDVDLARHYHESKAFLYAPVGEPFGIVVLEAVACGLPVVCYKHGGGYAEILNKDCGIIMNNLNQQEWAKKIEILLNDYDTQTKIQIHNSRFAKKHSDKIYASKLLETAKHYVH